MTAQRRGLGRGLDALLSDVDAATETARSEDRLRELPVEQLERGRFQPRKNLDAEALAGLADSIRAQGIVQPLVVRALAPERYEIIAGERRWRAAQLAGLATVPAIVREVADRAAVAVALIENIQREDLNALEEAEALARLTEEFELTHAETAGAVGRSRAAVTNLLRLLELGPEAKRLLREGRLAMGQARALLALGGSEQADAARKIAEGQLSTREAEALVRRLKSAGGKVPAAPPDPNVLALERELTERLGARVSLRAASGGKGRLIISYASLDELDGILARLR
ncbi:MAG TPA: ParB/RepB/Spo0J family partition protein [Gammaproteobacteria bacterium]|nr:ParB/RepB/Spo0J family partition protein [Gammaproteobacteria bacterium]